MNHWVFNTDPTEIEITAMGPFAITYADPKDDPRNEASWCWPELAQVAWPFEIDPGSRPE